ncbi:MAG: hypothetical protein M5U33_06520 [Pseudorhodoplanes sp.]|nr:hypothetical protein [Pseudorhodoplanes sp.]
MQQNGHLGLPIEAAEMPGFFGDDRQARIGGIRRQPGNLRRIGKRNDKLIGAQIEGYHAMRDVRIRRTGQAKPARKPEYHWQSLHHRGIVARNDRPRNHCDNARLSPSA